MSSFVERKVSAISSWLWKLIVKCMQRVVLQCLAHTFTAASTTNRRHYLTVKKVLQGPFNDTCVLTHQHHWTRTRDLMLSTKMPQPPSCHTGSTCVVTMQGCAQLWFHDVRFFRLVRIWWRSLIWQWLAWCGWRRQHGSRWLYQWCGIVAHVGAPL